ncbi:MAG: ACP S-malonyltransferase [Bacillota bacterium]
MLRTAVIFPGQGSQYVGMGKKIAAAFPEAREIFTIASDALNRDLGKLCFEGPEDELKQTKWTQPALLTTSYAVYRILGKEGFTPDAAAGHSLGEYTALVAAGALRFSDAVRLVHERGKLMEEAVPGGKGTMAAVLGVEREILLELLGMLKNGVVEAANFNCPEQIVISGETSAVTAAGEAVTKKGGKVIPLAVSGPFHSSLMKTAADKFHIFLDQTNFIDAEIPVFSNAWAREVQKASEIRMALLEQLFSPVRWEDSIQIMMKSGIACFLEIGPKKILSGLVRKISPGALICNAEDPDSIQKMLAFLKEV